MPDAFDRFSQRLSDAITEYRADVEARLVEHVYCQAKYPNVPCCLCGHPFPGPMPERDWAHHVAEKL